MHDVIGVFASEIEGIAEFLDKAGIKKLTYLVIPKHGGGDKKLGKVLERLKESREAVFFSEFIEGNMGALISENM